MSNLRHAMLEGAKVVLGVVLVLAVVTGLVWAALAVSPAILLVVGLLAIFVAATLEAL